MNSAPGAGLTARPRGENAAHDRHNRVVSSRRPDPDPRAVLAAADPVQAAHLLLGGVLTVGAVGLRIVEVEAYGGDEAGPWPDPAAHSYQGRTPRNAVMFGPAGHLYVYRSYGLHFCANVSCGPDGIASAVLLRAARVESGHDVVARRRPGRRQVEWARGPGNLGASLGVTVADSGTDLLGEPGHMRLALGGAADATAGPRVGVTAAADRPWRFRIAGAPEVSAYRRSSRAPSPGAESGSFGDDPVVRESMP
ncbi:DNA-3-methyladenine glycosylase [Rhodococcus rhodnii]|nr:DNA-3-methyladenine glycosylase [Rhodococcus rhodnii]